MSLIFVNAFALDRLEFRFFGFVFFILSHKVSVLGFVYLDLWVLKFFSFGVRFSALSY